MLPTKYLQSRRSDNDRDDEDGFRHRSNNKGRRQQASYGGNGTTNPPPLGLTGVLCESKDLSIPNRGSLHYTIFRPRNLLYKPPLICIAGGPLLPCNYLQPIVHLITDRSVVFYDALGCGQSKLEHSAASPSTTTNNNNKVEKAVQIPEMVRDLQCLIQHLSLPNFHLLGHSFGGIVAYEYLKSKNQQQQQQPCHDVTTSMSTTSKCLSLIMVSTPVSIAEAVQHSHELQNALRQREQQQPTTGDDDDHHREGKGNHKDDHDDDVEVLATYARLHECRMDPLPLPLQQSFAGVFPSASKGLAAVQYYTAAADSDDDHRHHNKEFPPALILRGEYDFVSTKCQEKWVNYLNNVTKFVTIPDSAHYGMLENETLFAETVRAFLPDPAEEFITLPNGVKVRR